MSVGSFEINGWPVHYEKHGKGSQVVLLVPGAIGTGMTDFWEQLKGPFAFDMDQYTFIAIEMPGWGRSRPPLRPYGDEYGDVYYNDADVAQQLMEKLNYKFYSVIGWSDGAKVSLIMASKYQARIDRAVAIGPIVLGTEYVCRQTLATANTKTWNKALFGNYLRSYTADEIQQLWTLHMEPIERLRDRSRDDFEGKPFIIGLEAIHCPVLVCHGNKDPLVPFSQVEYLNKIISDIRVHRFPNGSHNCHQQFAEDFLEVVDDFLQE